MRGNVDTIKERLDITEVLSGYLKLEKTGANFKARCPFHNEKTPSFFVSPARQSYYCFGCGAKGDMFTFVEEIEGVDFRGALKLLAEKAGVEIEFRSPEIKTEKDKIANALAHASQFFESEIEKRSEVNAYLSERGILPETVKKWHVGYAPAEWRALYSYLQKLGFTKEILLKAGLIKKVDDPRKEPYDTFRGRIMFPISDSSGRITAFSGRLFLASKETTVEEGPKYLNSPDTVLFNKSETLYGLDKAKEEIRRKDFTILVEGQMDLVLSHQAGVANAVAASGTAFTPTHLERLKRLSQRIILAFDGDEAGEKAAERSSRLGLSLGMEVKIAPMPEGEDPAELVLKGPSEWKNALRKSLPAVEFFLNKILEREKDSRKAGKLIEKRILPLMALIPSAIEKSHFVSLVAKRSGIREEILWEDLKKIKIEEILKNEETKDDVEEKKIIPRKTHIERRLIGIIFWQEGLPQPQIDVSSLRAEMTSRLGGEYFEKLLNILLSEKESLIFEAENYYSSPDRMSKDISELLNNLSDDLLREKLTHLIAELSRAEADKDDNAISSLSREIQVIHQKMAILEKEQEKI